MVPLRSASVIPGPTTSPSTCWNIGEWVMSSSRRKTFPGQMMRTSGGCGFESM